MGQRGAAGPVDQVPHLVRVVELGEEPGDVLEQRQEVDLLVEAAALGREGGLPDECDDRLVVEPGVVQTVQEVHRAGP